MPEPTVLGEVAQVVDCEHKTAPMAEPGTEFGYSIGTPNLKAGRIDFSSAKRVDRKTFGEWSRRAILRRGDLILAREAPVGQVAYVNGGQPVCLGQRTVLIRSDPSRLDSRYLHYRLLGPTAQSWMAERAAGSTVPHLNVADVRQVPLPDLPPTGGQRRIAGVLGALDDLTEINDRIRTTLDRKGVALVENLVLRKPDRDVVILGDAASLIEAGRRPRGGVRGICQGVPSIGAESIDGLGVFDFSKTKFIPADFAAQMRTGVLESRDVLIYKDGGKPGEFRPHVGMYGDGFPFARMTINEHVYRVRAAAPLTEPYLYFWLSTETSMAAMRRLGTGAAIPGLNSTALKSIPVAIPPTNIQQRLFPALEAFVGEALAAASEARRLVKARDELLPLLLSGRIHVEDVAV